MHARLAAAFARLPLVAILRGVKPDEAPAIADVLIEQGFDLIEVPLNSPHPLRSIEAVRRRAPAHALVGAGTVLTRAQVDEVADAGGDLIVTPNTNPDVIAHARARGMICLPGAATPSEAFAALGAGADAVKAFPAEAVGPAVVKAWLAVLPKGTAVLPVGGIAPETMAAYITAGAAGFGLGSALYRPGDGAEAVSGKAAAFRTAWAKLQIPA